MGPQWAKMNLGVRVRARVRVRVQRRLAGEEYGEDEVSDLEVLGGV